MRRKISLRQAVIAFDREIFHNIEWALSHLERNLDVPFGSHNFGHHFCLAIPSGTIRIAQVLDTGPKQRVVVLAARKEASLFDADVRLQFLVAQAVVTLKPYLADLEPPVFVNVIHDGHAILVILYIRIDFGVEITLTLE